MKPFIDECGIIDHVTVGYGQTQTTPQGLAKNVEHDGEMTGAGGMATLY